LRLPLQSDGFTLLEILVAIVILSISLLALAGLMSTTSRNTSLGGHITEAATFAQDRLEQLRVTPWASIATGTDATPPGATGIIYTRTWNVVQNGTFRTVTINMNWNEAGVTHSFNLVSGISE
jgi:prepilin-type N-terminal cleavage/methylation domain-containing protein